MAEAFFSFQPSRGEIDEKVEGFPSWIEVDLDRIGFNLERIMRQVNVEVIPCLKANAYGHGIVPVAAYLMMRGVRRVLVAKLGEALQLREAGLDCGIINMDYLFSEEQREAVVEKGITQVVFNRAAAEALEEAARRLRRRAEVFIKVDTGLGRVGARHGDAIDLIEHVSSLPRVRVVGVFSTFAEDKCHDRLQLERMLVLDGELRRRGLAPGTRSMASSHAILNLPEAYLDAVRPGLTLYGVFPDEGGGTFLELRQALSFKARLEQVKWIEAGESVTYGKRFIAPHRMRAGTVHVGYSDGYPRGLTNKGLVYMGGELKSVLGTVSVNHFVFDLTGTDTRVGDVVEVIGMSGENSVDHVARLAGITPYGLLVGLSPLTPRVYYQGGRPVALSEPRLAERGQERHREVSLFKCRNRH